MAELCKQGHDSPRRKNVNCIQCEKERYRADPTRKAYVKAKQAERRADPVLGAKHREYMKTYERDKDKANAHTRERYKANSALMRLKRLGVEPTEEVISYIRNHDGFCDICGGPPDGKHGTLVYDHCHRTSAFRGILCNCCNKALGLFRDNASNMRKAADYIDHYVEG